MFYLRFNVRCQQRTTELEKLEKSCKASFPEEVKRKEIISDNIDGEGDKKFSKVAE